MSTVNTSAQLNVVANNGDIRKIYPKTTIENVDGLQTILNGKVDTVSGKGLSTNDYTTAEKNKLAGIAEGATANVGTVTSVKVGNTSYNPSSGVVSLPEYPSDTNTHRPIQVNGTEILGNNTTALNLKEGSNVSISNSNGTVTFAATDTTYSEATQSTAGLMSAADKTKLDKHTFSRVCNWQKSFTVNNLNSFSKLTRIYIKYDNVMYYVTILADAVVEATPFPSSLTYTYSNGTFSATCYTTCLALMEQISL